MKASIVYSFMGVLGSGGIVATLVNLRSQTYVGKCWLLGGASLVIFVVVLLLLMNANKKRVIVGHEEETEKAELKSLLLSGDGFFIDISYRANDGDICCIKLNPKYLRMKERNNDDTCDAVTITKHTEYYQNKCLFIVWPTEVSERNEYELLVSRDIYVILDYFMRRCYA